MARTRTVCPFCGCGCSFYLVSEGDRVIGVEPSPANPVNRGMLCVKGWNAHEFIHSPDRLTVSPRAEAGGTGREHLGRGAQDRFHTVERRSGQNPVPGRSPS